MSADHDFLPALDRITDEPPDKGAVTVSRIVMVLVALLIAWACFGRLDTVVVAEGKLVPETYVKIVQPAEAGVVREILVKEGDPVSAGQVLARLDDTFSSADARAVGASLALKQLELRRIQAELRGVALLPLPGDDSGLFRQVRDHHRASRASYEDALAQADAEIARARSDIAAARQQVAKLEQVVPVFERELASYESLRGKGYVSELDYNAKQRELIDSRQNLAAQRDAEAGLQAALRLAEKRRAQVTSAYREDLEQQRAALSADIPSLQQESAKQTYRQRQLELRAPQAGVVKDLATHTAGTVVQPGAVLMTLVPVHEKLQAEVYVRNEDVGQLRAGLPAKIKVQAFRFQKYGMLGGEVVTLGADSVQAQPSASGAAPGPSLYKAVVAIRPVGDGAIDQQTLAAGMSVTAEIDVGTRTPLAYLLEPVRGTLSEAGREGR